MTKDVRYGVISDVHNNPAVVGLALSVFKNKGINKLLINGDIGEYRPDFEESQKHIAGILHAVGESQIETYVQPGSHESLQLYESAMDYFTKEYSNIINAVKEPVVDEKNHRLVFLPGSDINIGAGEYWLRNFNGKSGYYPIKKEGEDERVFYMKNMKDLKDQVKDPDKTIVVCHIPRMFDDINTGIDVAYFATKGDSLLPGIVFDQKAEEYYGRTCSFMEIHDLAETYGFNLRYENRGNVILRGMYKDLGITKGISGHFHESGHRAVDALGNPSPEGVMTNDLFWNTGHLDIGQTGILSVGDGKISYQNINLQDYIRK